MIEPLRLPEGLLSQTFEVLRECGDGRDECVAFLTAEHGSHTVVDVVHPAHSGGPWHYEVQAAWMTRFFSRLRDMRHTAVAQVHTHGGRAFHSKTDDQFPLVPAVGFLSLVVPNFAQGPASLDGMYATVLEENGWRSLDPSSALRVTSGAG